MASNILQYNGLLGSSSQLLTHLTPRTLTDVIALLTAGCASAAYLLRGYAWDKSDPYNFIWFEKPQSRLFEDGQTQKATRNIAQTLEELGKDVVIFWGSQSGTAEGFAGRLARELSQRYRLQAMAADLSDFDPETIALVPKSKFAILILSTYGEGDPSDNTAPFWEWLQKLGDLEFTALRYAAFGLGNSNYKHYNRVVDVVDAILHDHGADRLMATGKADDAKGTTEEDFLAWKDELLEFLRVDLRLEEHGTAYQPTLSVVEDTSLEPIDLHAGEPVHFDSNNKATAINSPIRAFKIQNAREIFTSKNRNCLHMELDLSSAPEISYKTGDHLAIWPMNPNQEVERLAHVLGIAQRLDTPICINALDPAVKIHISSPTSLEALLRYYVEICAPVSRGTARTLADFAPSQDAKTFLLNLTADKETFATFSSHNHVTIGRLLEMAAGPNKSACVWEGLPLAFLLENIPRTRPRYYSISSSSVLSPRSPAITALVSSTSLPGDAFSSIPGLATNYLLAVTQSLKREASSISHPAGLTYALPGPEKMLEGGKVFAHVRRSTFKLPMQASCSIIMIAAGTGLAPFRAFIGERVRLKSIGRPVGRMILFFGCRHPDEDYIYRTELEQMSSALEGKLRIVTAFSRLQADTKLYVQDRVAECGRDVLNMVDEGANLYICGRASMARDVGQTLGNVAGLEKNWNETQTQEWITNLKRSRKWQEDVWG